MKFQNPISRLFLLLATFFYCYAVDENFNASLRWGACTFINFNLLHNKTVFLAYFSKTYVNKFQWKINFYNLTLPQHDSVVPALLSVCLCRLKYPPLKFTTPYLESNGDDIIALCVIGNENEEFTSLEIYDDEELYDYLILKHQELIPASVIDPFKHGSDASPSTAASDTDFTCFDQFFMQAKSIMEQRTCLFSASITSDSHSLYSGPLMSLPLMNFSMENITQYCYTTVKNTTLDSQVSGLSRA
uniref:Vomeronasal type 2 receptor n=1 Tax=Panagrolaimus davidi TaxID=227884 RepID=A0A914P7G4_9BILA